MYVFADIQVTFPKVKAKLILENVKRNIQQFTQVDFAPQYHLCPLILNITYDTQKICEIVGWAHASDSLGTQWACNSSVICLGCS